MTSILQKETGASAAQSLEHMWVLLQPQISKLQGVVWDSVRSTLISVL